MAFQFGDTEADSELAEINVTPLVDVMLVLLIIFMIAAPLLHPGIEVALPKADAPALPLRTEDPLVVSINRDGIVYLQDQPVHPSQLVERLLPVLRARGDDTVLVKGDRDVAYGRVIEVFDVLRQGGVTNLGLVTQDGGVRRRR